MLHETLSQKKNVDLPNRGVFSVREAGYPAAVLLLVLFPPQGNRNFSLLGAEKASSSYDLVQKPTPPCTCSPSWPRGAEVSLSLVFIAKASLKPRIVFLLFLHGLEVAARALCMLGQVRYCRTASLVQTKRLNVKQL